MDFYKTNLSSPWKFHIPLVQKITELPNKDQRMAQLQEDIEYIEKVDAFTEEDIHHFVGQAYVNAYLLEDICKTTSK